MKFEELSKINVNTYVEKKNGLPYLSWAWAVDYMSRLDETAEWEYREWDGKPYLKLPDETCMVYCTVTFGGKKRTAHLPVMDHRNKAIQNPDAFQINTTMQRALVKAIALHGLGLYIYAGEDLPKDEADKKEEPPNGKLQVTPTAGARDRLDQNTLRRVEAVASSVIDCFTAGLDAGKALEIIEENDFDADAKVALWTYLDSKMRSAIKKAAEAKRKPALAEQA